MHDQAQPTRRQLLVMVSLYWLAIAACTVLPWVLHFAVGWWAGLLVFFVMTALYQRLFVSEGSICMGIFFGIPLGSFLALILLDVVLLLRWLVSIVIGC